MPIPKKGDVVWLKGWRTIGVVQKFDEKRQELTLALPNKDGGYTGPKIFIAVKTGDIKVLSPVQVLEKVFEIFDRELTNLSNALSDVMKNFNLN